MKKGILLFFLFVCWGAVAAESGFEEHFQVLSRIPENELREIIQKQTAPTWAGTWLEKYPVLTEIFIDLIKSPTAIPSLLRIPDNKASMKIYLWGAGILFILGLIFPFTFSKDKNFLQRMWMRLTGYTVIMFLQFGLFYFLFKPELEPTLKVLSKNLF